MADSGKTFRMVDLPRTWFDRRQYRPRSTGAVGSPWYLLDASFAPMQTVPEATPAEPACGRAALREAFEATYRGWGLPRTSDTERSLSRIDEEGAAVVATGQQPGFLGGPLMTLYKALTVIAASRDYRARTGRPCVPVFWVAGEDHDLDETRDALFPGTAESGGITFRYPHPSDRRPLSDYPMDAAASEVLEAARTHVSARRHGREAQELLALLSGRAFAAGFAAIFATLLGREGLLLLDPATLRQHAYPVFRRVIEHPEEVLACVERGRREVRALGVEPIVSGRFPLFILIDGKRHHLTLTSSGLAVDGGGPSFSRDELLATLRRDPRAFSPGALLRPLLQQALLPCVLAVGGPAEVGYFAQIGPLADYLGVKRPLIALRFQATLVDGKLAGLARSLDLERLVHAQCHEDLLAKEEEAQSVRALREILPQVEAALLKAVEEIASTPEATKLRARAAEIPTTIRGFVERVEKAHLRRRTGEVDMARKLWDFIFPEAELQERHWCTLHFIARHGTRWIHEIVEELSADPLRMAHRWITFQEEA